MCDVANARVFGEYVRLCQKCGGRWVYHNRNGSGLYLYWVAPVNSDSTIKIKTASKNNGTDSTAHTAAGWCVGMSVGTRTALLFIESDANTPNEIGHSNDDDKKSEMGEGTESFWFERKAGLLKAEWVDNSSISVKGFS